MKLLSLLLFVPFLAFCIPSSDFTEFDLTNPHLVESAYRIRKASRRWINKRAIQNNGKRKTILDRKTIHISGISIKEAFIISNQDSLINLSLVFDETNGQKFLSYFLTKYEMPASDLYHWKFIDITFTVYQTGEDEYRAVYTL